MRTKTETLRHKQAFEFYYGMGEKRTLRKTAKHMNVAVVTTKKWSKDFSWQNRIALRDDQNSKALAKKTDNLIIKDKENYIKIIKAMTGKAVQDFREGLLRVEDVGDLERLIRLHLLLAGESTEINTVRVEVVETIVNHIIITVEKYVDDPKAITAISSEIRDWGGNGMKQLPSVSDA
tara:strand:- start:128 stop:661 length:534 start_codon:yes stop_codon:yes gene_type:complete